MTIFEIIKQLEKEGHNVQYTHRKDGGYIITRIDAKKFSGKTGNAFARSIVGAKLSEARQVQLARIRTPKGHWGHEKKTPLPESIKKALRKVQREWRKKHPDIRGTARTSNVRYQFEQYGEEATLQALDKNYRYAQGLAYIDNVNFLLQRIQNDLAKEPNSAMQEVYDLIQRRALEMKEEWLQPLHYDCLQQWENGIISPEDCAYKMKEIMNF